MNLNPMRRINLSWRTIRRTQESDQSLVQPFPVRTRLPASPPGRQFALSSTLWPVTPAYESSLSSKQGALAPVFGAWEKPPAG